MTDSDGCFTDNADVFGQMTVGDEDRGLVLPCGVSLVRERVDLFHVTFTSRTENVTKKAAFTSGCSGEQMWPRYVSVPLLVHCQRTDPTLLRAVSSFQKKLLLTLIHVSGELQPNI